jgi:H+-transporting ATPase
MAPVADRALAETSAAGLSWAEAKARLATLGPNAVASEDHRPLHRIARHFWAPVPWMLEVVIMLQLAAGEWLPAAMIFTLLLLNAGLGFTQESRADATLALLRQRLTLKAQVRRDGIWCELPVADLVPGDVVRIGLGAIVPADVRIISGSLLLDQSMLTGESIASDVGPDQVGYASALVRRGKAIAEVTATGGRTYFGKTADLQHTAG